MKPELTISDWQFDLAASGPRWRKFYSLGELGGEAACVYEDGNWSITMPYCYQPLVHGEQATLVAAQATALRALDLLLEPWLKARAECGARHYGL